MVPRSLPLLQRDSRMALFSSRWPSLSRSSLRGAAAGVDGTSATDTPAPATASELPLLSPAPRTAVTTARAAKPENSPFASYHRKSSTSLRRWEWEEGTTPTTTTSSELMRGDKNVANSANSASMLDDRATNTTSEKPSSQTTKLTSSSASRPVQGASCGSSSNVTPRMSLTIRSPQQRAHDRQRVLHNSAITTPTSPRSTTHRSPSETQDAVMRRRAGAQMGSREDLKDAAEPIPSSTLRTGASFAASNPKRFNTRLTIHPQRGISRFTEPVKRIVLLRNGVSEANEDISAYVRTPDWRIPLTEEGRLQCLASGKQLADLVGDEPVYFYYSPYIRSRQSLRYVLEGYDQRRMQTLQGEASGRLEWWERDDERGREGVTRAVTEATGAEQMNAFHTPVRAHATGGEGVDGLNPTLASVSSTFTATGTVSPSSVFLSSDAKREAAAAARRAGASSPDHSTFTSSEQPRAALPPHNNHVLPTGPSLVLQSGALNHIIGVREDVRLRDGDIGRYNDLDALLFHLREREQYGRFFYRFPFGESGADVCDRVTSFLDAFQRERVDFPMDTNVVIITHGLTIRMFIKRWFHLTVDTFHRMQSPPSASLCTLTRLHHQSAFRLDESCVESMALPQSLNEHNGYKYRNKRLLGSMSTGAPYM